MHRSSVFCNDLIKDECFVGSTDWLLVLPKVTPDWHGIMKWYSESSLSQSGNTWIAFMCSIRNCEMIIWLSYKVVGFVEI